MKTAIYAGSMDPCTKGHLWVIREGVNLFDKVIVVVAANAGKRYTFSKEKRIRQITAACYGLPVEVVELGNELLVHFAQSHNAKFLLRGVRNIHDYEYENGIRHINNKIGGDITTLFVMPPKELTEVSSSFVKGLVGIDRWAEVVSDLVPKITMNDLLDTDREFWHNLIIANFSRYFKMDAYTSPNRYYHNLNHVYECLRELETAPHDQFEVVKAIKAILIHDMVYDPYAKDNEEKSALFAGEDKEVAELVLDTKHNRVPATATGKFVCDVDLAGFGQPYPSFVENNNNIALEYSKTPKDEYVAGRARFLAGILDRPTIYYTEHFKNKLEVKARENIRRFLAESLA